MTKRLAVLLALKELVAAALPLATVLALGEGEADAARVDPNGRVILRSGDPGDPQVDLSPPVYNWSHRVPVEIVGDSEAQVDAMIAAIGIAIEADRTLGGLCDWLDAEAPLTDDIAAAGGPTPRGASLALLADYTTTSPLG